MSTANTAQTDITFVAATNLRTLDTDVSAPGQQTVGEIDPTYNPARKNWNIAKVDMSCEKSQRPSNTEQRRNGLVATLFRCVYAAFTPVKRGVYRGCFCSRDILATPDVASS